jgi:hypothetical protein
MISNSTQKVSSRSSSTTWRTKIEYLKMAHTFTIFGLYLRFWMDRFSPQKEDFSFAPVWILLYSLPHEFWLEEILMGIGNTLGQICKILRGNQTKEIHLICQNLCLHEHLQGSSRLVTLEYQDEDWTQTIDYEHIPLCY